jgi:Uma2 family endonuclease
MTTLSSFVPTLDSVPLTLTRLTADEYIAAAEAGAFQDGRRVELIEGLIIDMSPAGSKHHHYLMNLTELFAPLLKLFRIAVQGTLRVNNSQVFDPDFMLLRRKKEGYHQNLPQPKDVQLLIEVAESSLPRDCKVKLPIDAAAGIQDYWIMDIDRETLLVHRLPVGERYDEVREFGPADRIAPLAAPDFTLDVASIFA